MSVLVRPETDQDRKAVHHVNQAAFDGDAEAIAVVTLGVTCC